MLFTIRRAFKRLFSPPPRQAALFAVLLIVFSVFVVAHPALAQTSNLEQSVAELLGSVAAFVGYWITKALLMAVNVLVIVAGYNDFVTSAAVERGWVIVRDVTNMFFVLVMLVIAFGTILGVEEYGYKRMLPRLLIMAVLINFSKVITGLFIDFAQVIMFTFVDGFSAVAAGNFLNMFRVNSFLTPDAAAVRASVGSSEALWATVGSLILAAVMMLIALATVVIFVMILVFRIVMLWLLVVISPLAFFLSAFPKGRAADAYAQWWKLFGNYVVIGPFIAFFLWLSLAVTGAGDLAMTQGLSAGTTAASNSLTLFNSQGGQTQVLISFIIGVSMLLGGMTLAAQFGVAGGSMMASTAQWFQQKGKDAFTKPFGMAAGIAGQYARLGEARFAQATGIRLPGFGHYTTGWKKGMEQRIALADKDAKESITARIQRGDWKAPFYKLMGDPEGAARAGLINTTTKGVKMALGTTPGRGWEHYAEIANASRGRMDEMRNGRSALGDLRTQALEEELDANSAVAMDATQPQPVRAAANTRALQLNEIVQKLKNKQELDQHDRDTLTAMKVATPTGTDNYDRLASALGQMKQMDAIDVDIGKENKTYRKYDDIATRARAYGLKTPAELGKHGMTGRELGVNYRASLAEGDVEGALRMAKFAGVNGEFEDFGKEIGAELKGVFHEDFQNIINKVKSDTKASNVQVMEVADEVSASNKGKDLRYSNQIVVGSAGSKRFATPDEKETADYKDSTKGENFAQLMRKGIMKQVGTEKNGKFEFTPAGLYGFAANIDKITNRLNKKMGSAEDIGKMIRHIDDVKEAVLRMTKDSDRNAMITKLDNWERAVRESSSSKSDFDEFLETVRRGGRLAGNPPNPPPAPAAPAAPAGRGGGRRGGGGGGGGGGGAPRAAAPAPVVPPGPPPARPVPPPVPVPPPGPPPPAPTPTPPPGAGGGAFGGAGPFTPTP